MYSTGVYTDISYTSVKKDVGGEFAFRCNTFSNLEKPIISYNYTTMNLSNFSNNYGYNNFINSTYSNITFGHALVPQLNTGYNKFKYGSANGLFFRGSIAPIPQLDAEKNQWFNAGLGIPSQMYFGILSSNGAIIVDPNPAAVSSTCGEFDSNSGWPYINGVVHADLPFITLPSSGFPVIVDELLGDAISLSKVYSENGNNANSLQLFHDIIVYDYSTTNVNPSTINLLLDYAINQMKFTLQNAFEIGDIQVGDNVSSFHSLVSLYVDALNIRSSYIQ